MPIYNNMLSPEDQLEAEELVASILFTDSEGLGEEQCQDLSRIILKSILLRFKPEFFTNEH
jgi:hypothetical protein